MQCNKLIIIVFEYNVAAWKMYNVKFTVHKNVLQYTTLLKPTGQVMHQQFNMLKRTGHVMHQ